MSGVIRTGISNSVMFSMKFLAVARDVKHTDERIQLEMLAGKMMSKAIH